MATIVALHSSKSQGKVKLTDSEGLSVTTENPADIFEFLAKPYGAIKVVWDIEAFLKPILGYLPDQVVRLLKNGDQAHYIGAKLFWGVGKGQMLGVRYIKEFGGGNVYTLVGDENIYQIKTFFPNETADSLEEVKERGQVLLDTLSEMGLFPTSLTSPASIISECVLKRMSLPNIFNMPEDALECAEWSANYVREWRSVYKIGKFDKAWDYDLTAAYSSIMAGLPNLLYADYIKTNGEVPKGAYWGILQGVVTIDKEISPIIAEDGKAYKGTYPDFITTDDWDCIRRWGIGDFKPEAGWFVRLKKLAYPFNYIMRKYYSYRGGDDLKDYLAKHMVNTLWGKMVEKHVKKNGIEWGDFYFPPYACMTTSKMRCADCDFIYGHGLVDDLVSVTVDGLLATRETPGVPAARKFGEWRVDSDTPALVLGTAFQWVGDKRPGNVDVNQMLEAVTAHPMSRSWHGIALRFIEQDRRFESLPKNGQDVLTRVYIGHPLSVGGVGTSSGSLMSQS